MQFTNRVWALTAASIFVFLTAVVALGLEGDPQSAGPPPTSTTAPREGSVLSRSLTAETAPGRVTTTTVGSITTTTTAPTPTTTAPPTTTTTAPPATTTTAPPTTTTTAPPTTTTAPPATTTTAPPAGGIDSGAEQQFVSLINSLRADSGVAGLGVDGNLTGYARDWSRHMADTGNFEHSNIGSLLGPWSRVGENIAWGYSVNSMFDGLADSPGHRANMLNPEFTHVGVGAWKQADGRIWTTHVFGG